MERKKTSLIILGVCVLVLSVIGVTYAYWQLRLAQKDNNTIGSSCFNVTFTEDGSAIQLEKAYPIEDTEGKTLTPYKFTITNTCEANASYQINLEALEKYKTTTIDSDKRLNPAYIRAQLNEVSKETEEETEIEKEIVNLDSDIQVDPTLDNEEAKSYDAYKLAIGYLGPNESKSFALRIWLDGKLTTANEDAMNKTFASKITIITSYLSEEKIPPVAELELAVCENTITAKGTATPAENKSIEKYEFKIDAEDWTDNSKNQTTSFNVEGPGSHTVSLRVTDNKGITSETSKTIEIGEPETVRIYGKDIPITTCKNGLYEVPHDDEIAKTMDAKWQETEYRFAGVGYDTENPDTPYVHNYVWFNEELWRIIGLVNVKVDKGNEKTEIEQRLKIIRDDKLGNYSWDYKTDGVGSSDSEYGSNDWTDSQLMEMLNGVYYKSDGSDQAKCYKSGTLTDCKFDGSEGSEGKGLSETARGMIDESIIWNLGGSKTYNSAGNGLANHWYRYERGTTVYKDETVTRPTEWSSSNTKTPATTEGESTLNSNLFHSIALPYAGDYAYATNGGTLGREECFNKELYSWNIRDYKTQCAQTDWLKPESEYMWLLSPRSSDSDDAFYVNSGGCVDAYRYVRNSFGVWPTLYLSPSVKIVDNENDGSYDKPYELSDHV